MRTFRLVGVLLLVVGCATADFHAAEEMVRQQKFYNAIELYMSFAKAHPQNRRAPEALYEVGNIQQMMLNEQDKAMATFRSLVANYPVNEYTLKAQKRVAEISKDHFANYRQAIIDFEKLIRADPKGPEAPTYQLEIAKCYTLLHNYDQASIEYHTILTTYPGYAKLDEVYFEMGNNAYIKGDYTAAIEAYRTVESKFPKSQYRVQAVFGLGNAFEEIDAFDDALGEYEKVLKTYPARKVVQIRIQGLEERRKKKMKISPGAVLR